MSLIEHAQRWLGARPALARVLRSRLGPVVRRLRGGRASGAAAGGYAPPSTLRWLRAILGLGVTRDEVIWCYRQLLGREPESDRAVQWHLGARDFEALVRQFAETAEFAAGLPRHHPLRRNERGAEREIREEEFRRAINEQQAGQPPSDEQAQYVEVHFERLLHTLNVVHRRLPVGGSMVDYSAAAFFSHAVQRLHPDVRQSSITGVNFELDDYVERFGEERYDLCLNTGVLEHLAFDPAWMFFAINRMLKSGGHLFLTTPNAVSLVNAVKLLLGQAPVLWSQFKPTAPYYERHNREWPPDEVCTILRDHGFEVVEVYTRDFYASTRELLSRHQVLGRQLASAASHAHLGDTLCVLARKRIRVETPTRAAWLYA